jgi:integrase
MKQVKDRLGDVIVDLFDIQTEVAAALEESDAQAEQLRQEFLQRLQEKQNNTGKTVHIEKENDDMPNLKYGDGCILTRYRKLKCGKQRRFYEGKIYINGKQKSVYASTQAECLQKLKELREDKKQTNKNDVSNLIIAPTSFKNYGQWLDEWFDQFKVGRIRDNSLDEVAREVKRIKEVFGDSPIKKLSSLQLLHYFNSQPRTNTLVKRYDIVNNSLQKAEDFELIKKNPCKAIQRPTYVKEKRRPFELAEQVAILNALSERYSKAYFFLCCTGLRIGEFLALTPADVDFKQHYILVNKSRNIQSGVLGETKTANSVRKVYFNDKLFEVFDVQELGTYTYNAIKKAFQKVFKRLDLKDISVTHSCRHTYASMMYAVNISDKVIQRQMGHASLSTTMDVYTDILLNGESPILDYIRALKSTLVSTLVCD